MVVGTPDVANEVRSALYECAVRLVIEQAEAGDWAPFLENLEKTRTDVVVLGLDQIAGPLEDAIRQIKATSALPKVIIVDKSEDPRTILRAVRAGADEYLYPPLGPDLRTAVERIAYERAALESGTRPRGKVFGVIGAKGGCGASTVACHLAVALQQQTQLEVLIIDYDLDAGMIGFLMQSRSRYSVMDAVANAHRLDLSFWKALVSNGHPGVEVLMGPPDPALYRERNLADFRYVLPFVRSNYDWTLVDLGRGLSPLALTVLEELEEIFLVTQVDIPALHQTKQMIQSLLGTGYSQERIRIVMNRLPKRTDITMAELDRMLGIPIYATIADDYATVSEAYAEKRLAPPGTAIGRDFARLAQKAAGVESKQEKKGLFGFRK